MPYEPPAKMVFVLAEYMWIDAALNMRCKSRVYHGKAELTLEECKHWNFDGSSTGQAPGEDSEVVIRPVALFDDPFRGAPHKLVLCDCYTPKGVAIPTNTRAGALAIFQPVEDEEPWFGVEQE